MRDQLQESIPAPEATRRDDAPDGLWARVRTPGNDTDEQGSEVDLDREESRVPGDDELDEEGSVLGGEEEAEEEEEDGDGLEEDGG